MNQNGFNSNNNHRANQFNSNQNKYAFEQNKENEQNNYNQGYNNNGFNGNGSNRMNGTNRGGFNGTMNQDDSENEIAAPPTSTAADLIRKLESEQGAFEQPQDVQRIACRQCGRKFAQPALQRHIKICKKVFGQKRKAFKTKAVDDEAIKARRNTDTNKIEKELERKRLAAKQKWKSQSQGLREAIKASKAIEQAMKEGKSLADIPQMQSQVPDTRVPCPHCGRKFAEETAKRHIPKCQNIKSRPKALKRRR